MTTETSNARGEWVLVPRELTPEMREAWEKAPSRLAAEWAALLAAAPPPAAARGDVRGLVSEIRNLASEFTDEGGASETMLGWADRLEAALAAEGVQAGEVEQRAREVLKREPGQQEGESAACYALRIATATLSQQPEARGVVDDGDGFPVGFADWYNRTFRGRGADTHHLGCCEEAWRAALTGERNG